MCALHRLIRFVCAADHVLHRCSDVLHLPSPSSLSCQVIFWACSLRENRNFMPLHLTKTETWPVFCRENNPPTAAPEVRRGALIRESRGITDTEAAAVVSVMRRASTAQVRAKRVLSAWEEITEMPRKKFAAVGLREQSARVRAVWSIVLQNTKDRM